jgi:DNA-binding PadR family transcriptional regulator
MHHHSHTRGWRAFAHFPERGLGRMLHERGHERHQRRGGRVFDQGDLRWIILKLIADKPSHGYELIKQIEERLGGAYAPSPGVVYPTLTLLEDLGHIAPVEAEGARKAYAITPEGQAALDENTAAVTAILERMAQAAERNARSTAPQIVRAMENVGLALRLRLQRGGLDEARIAAIAAVLDNAAKEIERE